MVGLLVGSFLGTLTLRWPRGEGIVRGRSHCDGCGRPLAARDLVPLLSFALAHGRCRACGNAIPLHHPLVETGCAIIGATAFALQPGIAGVAGALFGWTLLTLAVLDAEHFWLPDALTLPLGAAGLATGMAGLPPPAIDRAIGAALGFLMLEAVRRSFRRLRGREGLGAGDPKLFAALGAWLGWQALPALLSGAAGLGLLWTLWLRRIGHPINRDTPLPFGTMLAVAGWIGWVGRVGLG